MYTHTLIIKTRFGEDVVRVRYDASFGSAEDDPKVFDLRILSINNTRPVEEEENTFLGEVSVRKEDLLDAAMDQECYYASERRELHYADRRGW